MALLRSRGGKRVTNFERAADGSMTLFEHLRELRGRLFKAVVAALLGACVGYFFSKAMIQFLIAPYCSYQKTFDPHSACQFAASGGPLDTFVVQLKVSLYFGLVISSPIWLYQLWAFIAPGLHRRERRYAYAFAGLAAPLFIAGVVLAHLVVAKSLRFFLGSAGLHVLVDINGYLGFVLKMMVLFGAAFEFPLLLIMMNMTGMVTGRRLLGWWRQAIFLMFLFGAIVTPSPDPFSMSILAGCMAVLYFGAVAFALLNDRRKGRHKLYAELDDDEISPLVADEDDESVAAGAPIYAVDPVEAALPIERRFDDFT